ESVMVVMAATMPVAVMPQMCRVDRRVFQRIANPHGCHISGIQREHDGKKERETRAHEEVTWACKGILMTGLIVQLLSPPVKQGKNTLTHNDVSLSWYGRSPHAGTAAHAPAR